MQFVQLQLEQVGQVFGGILSAAPTAATTLLLLDTHLVVGLFRPLQMLKGALLGRKRGVDVLLLQRGLRRGHLYRGPRQDFQNGAERRIGRHDAAVHPTQQRIDLFAQPTLRERQKDEVLAILVFGERVPITHHVEGGRNDLPLGFRERPGVTAAATATTATAAL